MAHRKEDMGNLDVEILTIGDELNRGEIIDTNSSWLATELTGLGAHVRWRSSVTDNAPDMEGALRQAAARARVVVCSGGLGPTDDDRTVDVVARMLGVTPVVDAPHEAKMVARFNERGFQITPNNLRQVRVPAGADVLENRKGLAPGFGVRLGSADLFFMPGVPREMKPIFTHQIAPRVLAIAGGATRTAKRTWRVAGMGESHVDHRLQGVIDGLRDATLHFRIAYPENLVTVVIRRDDEAEAQRELELVDKEVRARLEGHVYGTDDDTLATVIGRALVGRRQTLAVAESCTGGLVGELLTDVAGSSTWFQGGVISYSNRLKTELLGVSPETLARDGAVSEACVREMAAGARKVATADWALAISGVAGPSGGTPEKPVGTVWIGLAGPSVTETRHVFWPGERDQVRRIAAFQALHLLQKTLTR
jgi:nicotinamide-nucleotide amidase